tara:strand:+ start:766 stop:1155 length:390 start_codon:yes stop_codon:yes gene_type:complete
MALYEKRWWKNLFDKNKNKKQKIDVLKDMDAIMEFLTDLGGDSKILLKEFKRLKELEKERQVAKSGILQINLETQAKSIDKILERYEYLQTDVDINNLRFSFIVKEWIKNARKAGLKDILKEKQISWKK